MSRGPATFRKADVARAVRAAKDAGLTVTGIKISAQGEIMVVVGDTLAQDSGVNPWDRAIEELK